MTQEELDQIKLSYKRMHNVIRELWFEKQLLENLIIDSGWVSGRDLETRMEEAKKHPENIRQVAEHFSESEQSLAELGLDEWLAELDKRYPS
ncbi:MAG: hypothetical protein WCA10_05650 [Terracidiphilus sp.]